MKQVTFRVRRKNDRYGFVRLYPVSWAENAWTLRPPFDYLFPWTGLYNVLVSTAPQIGVYRIYKRDRGWSSIEHWSGKSWKRPQSGCTMCVPALRRLALNTALWVETEWLGE